MFENIRKEAVVKIITNVKFAFIGQIASIFGILYVLHDVVSSDLLFMLLIAHAILMIFRFYINYQYNGNQNRFLLLYLIIVILSGALWGSTMFLTSTLSIEYHLMVFVIIIGLISGAMFSLGEVFPLYVGFIVPLMLIVIFWLLSNQSTPVYTTVAYLGIFSFLYYLLTAKKYNENYNRTICEQKEKKLLLDELKDKSNNFELLFESSTMGALIIENGKFIQSNQKSVEMLGFDSKDELLQIPPDKISPQYQSDGRLSDEKAKEMMQKAFDDGSNSFEWLHKKKDGKLFLAEINLSQIILNGKKVLYTSWRDITQEKKQKNDLKHLAHHDSLTTLPNRMLFNDRLEQGIKKAQRGQSELAVLFIDLDKFKPVNDNYGHDVGDEVLIRISQLLRNALRNEDTLARIGGDEFTVILENIHNEENVSNLAQKLIDTINQPILIGENKFHLSLSIGISMYPKDAQDSKQLLKLADVAMYEAKDDGRDNFKLYKDIKS